MQLEGILVAVALLGVQASLFWLLVRKHSMRMIEAMALFVALSLSLALAARWAGNHYGLDVIVATATPPMCLALLGTAWGLGIARARRIDKGIRRIGLMLLGTLALPAVIYLPFGLALLLWSVLDPAGAAHWGHGAAVPVAILILLFTFEVQSDTVSGRGWLGGALRKREPRSRA